MGKKILSLLLAVALTSVVFVGCGKDKPAPATSASNTTTSGAYAPSKEMKITMWSTNDTDYIATEIPKENVVMNWLKNTTKVNLENIFGNGGGAPNAKLPQLLASDTLPEVIRGPLNVQTNIVEAEKGWELTEDIIKKYAPKIWEKVPNWYWDKIKIDGKIYSIPFSFPASKATDPSLSDETAQFFDTPLSMREFTRGNSIWIRDDILKTIYPEAKTYDELVNLVKEKNAPIGEAMMDVPIKSTKDYIDFMYKIKDLGLKEGNKPVVPFGFNGGDNWMALSFLGPEIMGSRLHFYTGSWNPVKKEIYLPLVTDHTKEMAKNLNKMIRDEVIESESLVHTQAQFDAKAMNGMYAMIIPSYVQGGDTIKINKSLKDAGKKYQYRPLMTQFDNMTEYPSFREPVAPFDHMMITKTVKEEDIPQLLNWMNTQYTDEFEDVFYWGPKDAGLYEENSDGTRKFKDEKFQKYFMDKDTSVGTAADFKGLDNSLCTVYARFMGGSKYHPTVLNKAQKYEPTRQSAFKFPVTSPIIQNVQLFPPCQGWSAEFSAIPEVVKFWELRQQWEDPYKVVFAAKSDKEFEEKWNKAVTNLKSLVDVDSMTKKMTEIARLEAEKLGIK